MGRRRLDLDRRRNGLPALGQPSPPIVLRAGKLHYGGFERLTGSEQLADPEAHLSDAEAGDEADGRGSGHAGTEA